MNVFTRGIVAALLVGQTKSNVLRDMGGRFRDGGTPLTTPQAVLLVLALVAIVGLASWWLRRWRSRQDAIVNDTGRLFEELTRAHELTREERSTLLRAARQYADIEPATVFLLPERIERVIEDENDEHRREVLAAIHQRLFASAGADRAADSADAPPSTDSSAAGSASLPDEPDSSTSVVDCSAAS